MTKPTFDMEAALKALREGQDFTISARIEGLYGIELSNGTIKPPQANFYPSFKLAARASWKPFTPSPS